MAAFQKFQPFPENLAEKVFNFGTDQLKIALTAAANPPVSTNGQLSQLTEISYTNCSTRNVTTSSSSQSGGTYKLVCADLTLTAGGGTVGPFQYVVLYDDTATNDELIGYWSYGSDVTLADTETFLIDFSAANGVLQIA